MIWNIFQYWELYFVESVLIESEMIVVLTFLCLVFSSFVFFTVTYFMNGLSRCERSVAEALLSCLLEIDLMLDFVGVARLYTITLRFRLSNLFWTVYSRSFEESAMSCFFVWEIGATVWRVLAKRLFRPPNSSGASSPDEAYASLLVTIWLSLSVEMASLQVLYLLLSNSLTIGLSKVSFDSSDSFRL